MRCQLIAVVVLVFATFPALAQLAGNPSTTANEQKCVTVGLTSDTDTISAALLEPYLQNRREFQAQSLAMIWEAGSADVLVKLSSGELGSTRVRVINSRSGETSQFTSSWTQYPGMIAMDVMTAVKAVCRPEVKLVPRPAPLQARTAKSDQYLRGFSVCSRTMWLNEEQLFGALRSRPELAAYSIHPIEGCADSETFLEVTHDAADPREYAWTLKARAGEAVAGGRVIANSSDDAAKKIAEEVVGDVTSRADANVRAALDDGVANPWATESTSASNESYSNSRAAPELVALAEHPHGFKHVMGRIGWWTGQVIVDATYVTGVALCALAAAQAEAPADLCLAKQ